MMDLKEAAALFATPARVKAVEAMIAGKDVCRGAVEGLEGSAAAMLLSSLPPRDIPYLIIADDIDAAGYLYNDLTHIAGADSVGILTATVGI